MTTGLKMFNGKAIPLGITLALTIAAILVSARQFVGWPLNATELDFGIMGQILAMGDAFQGTWYPALAENVSRLSVLPSVAGFLGANGVSAERQIVYLHMVQAFGMCLGPVAIFWVMNRGRSPWLTPWCLLLFLLSGHHYLAYFKLVTSTFISGFVIMTLTAGAVRYYRLTAALLGVVGMCHPTYFLVTTGALVFMQWCGSGPCLSRDEMIARLKPLTPCLFVVVPIVGYWLVNRQLIAQPQVDKDLWFAYMQARSDLAFPLRQGLFLIFQTICFLLLAGLVFRNEGKHDGNLEFASFFWLTIFAIALFAIQIVNSELIRSVSLTSLALTHRIPFTISIAAYAGLVAVTIRRFSSSERGAFLWLVALFYLIFAPGTIKGLDGKGLFVGLVFALQTLEDTNWTLLRKRPVVGKVVEPFLTIYTTRNELWRGRVKPFVIGAVVLIAASQYIKKTEWGTVVGDWRDFLAGDATNFDAKQREGRSEYREFIRFVTDHVRPDEQMLTVPFYMTQRFTPVPYRAVYLDWPELNYVLYMSHALKNVLEKLATYGIDPLEQDPECDMYAMIWAIPGRAGYRCQRMAFRNQAMRKTMAWRDNIPQIKNLAPKVSWVLIKQDAICSNDQIVARWGDFNLMRLDGAVASSGCNRTP